MTKSVLAITALAGALSTAALAGPITDEEKQYCQHDYRQYWNAGWAREQLAPRLHEAAR